MINHTIAVLRRYAEFTGRSSRAEYWYFLLAALVFGALFGLLFGVVGAVIGLSSAQVSQYINIVLVPVQLALLIPSLAVSIRRMHDVDKSGWFLLIPIYNLVLVASSGVVGDNRFGPDPKVASTPALATGPATDSVAN